MSVKWPEKGDRELFEIKRFIEHYKSLPHGRSFEVIGRGDNKKSGPDYFLRDSMTNERFGVELTSVYIDDRSIPDVHMQPLQGSKTIPYDPEEIENYKQRVLGSISKKIRSARSNYDTSATLILSIFINEYVSLYIDEQEWGAFIKQNEKLFDQISPFSEIVFWPLPNLIGMPPEALSVISS